MLIAPLFLLGLLGLAFPWWLHRLETQITEREKFSTTRFLEPSKKRIHVQRKLRYLVLMAVRMAFLAFMVFAFARPILFKKPEVKVVGDDNVHHVLMIDTSFSMHEGSKLNDARDRATQILANMKAGDIASLYAASSTLTTLVDQNSADEVRKQLPALVADNGRLDLGAMVAALNGLLKNSKANVALHVISDFQLTGQAVRFADMIPDVVNGRAVTLDIQQLGGKAPANFMVESVVVENRSSVIASVRAFNGEVEAGAKKANLSVNGTAVQTLDVPASSSGLSTVTFKNVMFGDGYNKVDIRLTPADSLAEDDIRYTVFDNSPPAPVLLLTPDAKSLGVTYLSAALSTAPRGYAVEAKTIKDFDARVLQRYPWLIIEDLGAVTPALATALTDYVHGGGAIFAALGQRSSGAGTVPVLNLPVTAPNPSKDQAIAQISQIDTSHPALNDSSGWNNVNVRAFKVTPTSDDRVLIAQNRDTPVLIERNIGAGHFVLFTSSLDNSASDLPVKPVFVSFMAELAQYLSNEKLLVKEQTADSYLQLTQSGGGSGQVEDPNDKKLLSLQGTTQAQEVLLNLTGYYRVFTPSGEVLVAVNPDRRESDLSPMTTKTLQDWQSSVTSAASAGVVAVDTAVAAKPSKDANEIEIWRFFLIGMAALVLAESLLGNRYLNFKTGTF